MIASRLSFTRCSLNLGLVSLASIILAGCTLPAANNSNQSAMPTNAGPAAVSPTLTTESKKAFEIAQNSQCAEIGTLSEKGVYNSNSNTWWFDINQTEKPNCQPACVVNLTAGTAEINWRCSGALSPEKL